MIKTVSKREQKNWDFGNTESEEDSFGSFEEELSLIPPHLFVQIMLEEYLDSGILSQAETTNVISSLGYLQTRVESFQYVKTTESTSVVKEARAMIKAQYPAEVYYSRYILTTLSPEAVHSLLAGGNVLPYKLGFGPDIPMYDRSSMVKRALELGYQEGYVGDIILKMKSSVLVQVFLPRKTADPFKKLNSLHKHLPRDLIKLRIKIANLSKDQQEQQLSNYFFTTLATESYDIMNFSKGMVKLYTQSRTNEKKVIRDAIRKFCAKITLITMNLEVAQLIKYVWKHLDRPLTNVKGVAAENDQSFNLKRFDNTDDLTRHLLKTSSVLIDFNLVTEMKNGRGTKLTKETVLEQIAYNLLQSETRVFLLLTPGTYQPRRTVLYVKQKFLIQQTTGQAVYELTLERKSSKSRPLFSSKFLDASLQEVISTAMNNLVFLFEDKDQAHTSYEHYRESAQGLVMDYKFDQRKKDKLIEDEEQEEVYRLQELEDEDEEVPLKITRSGRKKKRKRETSRSNSAQGSLIPETINSSSSAGSSSLDETVEPATQSMGNSVAESLA